MSSYYFLGSARSVASVPGVQYLRKAHSTHRHFLFSRLRLLLLQWRGDILQVIIDDVLVLLPACIPQPHRPGEVQGLVRLEVSDDPPCESAARFAPPLLLEERALVCIPLHVRALGPAHCILRCVIGVPREEGPAHVEDGRRRRGVMAQQDGVAHHLVIHSAVRAANSRPSGPVHILARPRVAYGPVFALRVRDLSRALPRAPDRAAARHDVHPVVLAISLADVVAEAFWGRLRAEECLVQEGRGGCAAEAEAHGDATLILDRWRRDTYP